MGEDHVQTNLHYNADNLTYGTGEDASNNGKLPNLEASTYEVPLSSCGAIAGPMRTQPEYELTESTYAVPNVNEYATLGPNEQTVKLVAIYSVI